MKMYQSVIKKKKKEHNKVLLLAKFKLNSLEDLTYKTLINSNISQICFNKEFSKNIWWSKRKNQKF